MSKQHSTTTHQIICPLPKNQYEKVLLAHGSGGKLTRQLLSSVIIPPLANPTLASLSDSAAMEVPGGRLAFTTDAFVVSPLFFPGGNIGDLAVNGTINDLAVSGATPLALSLALIIEEGCDVSLVDTVVKSVAAASKKAGVPVVTGDTKVVERGKCDQLYVVTSGIGLIEQEITVSKITPGDVIICNGTIGDHGIAVMAVREGLEFSTPPMSDSAALHQLISSIISPSIHFMRDPTRGGIASVLNEIAGDCGYDIELDEASIPIRENVLSACALLGLDPLQIANEGKVLLFVSNDTADQVLVKLRKHPLGKEAAIVGRVRETMAKQVIMKTKIGSERLVHMLPGEQLPRIC